MHRLHGSVSVLMRRVATEIMMPRFQKLAAHDIAEKTPGDPVTIVDRESEAFLGEELSKLLPDARIIGEEAASLDPSILDTIAQGLVWIIDPLDGTKNFSEGHAPFAIMIGLTIDGEREAGWILDPVSNRMCHAGRGLGAFINEARVTAKQSDGPMPKAAIPPYFLTEEQQTEIAQRAGGQFEITAIPRCAGEQYPRLVNGTNDIALFQRTLPWDHAAGALFLEEAGGKIARRDGSPYHIGGHGQGAIAAASPQLWDKAAKVLFS